MNSSNSHGDADPRRPTTTPTHNPLSSSSSSSNHDRISFDEDAYNQQEVSTILPPGRRSSVSGRFATRRESTNDAGLSWLAHRAPTSDTRDHLYEPSSASSNGAAGLHAAASAPPRTIELTPVLSSTANVVAAAPPPSAGLFRFHDSPSASSSSSSSPPDALTGSRRDANAEFTPSAHPHPMPSPPFPHASFPSDAALHAQPNPFVDAVLPPSASSLPLPGGEASHSGNLPPSLLHYRFGAAPESPTAASPLSSPADRTVPTMMTPTTPPVVSAPPPEDSAVSAARRLPASAVSAATLMAVDAAGTEEKHKDAGDEKKETERFFSQGAAIAAPLPANPEASRPNPPPYFGAPDAYPQRSFNDGDDSPNRLAGTDSSVATSLPATADVPPPPPPPASSSPSATGGNPISVVVPVPTETHVRFSSDIDIVEATSRGSTSTAVTDTHAHADAYEIDESEEPDNSFNNTVSSLHSDLGNSSSGGGRGRTSAERQGRSPTSSTTMTTQALPLLLTPDELQLERLKAYDRGNRQTSDSLEPDVGHTAAAQSHAENDDSGMQTTSRDVDVDDEGDHHRDEDSARGSAVSRSTSNNRTAIHSATPAGGEDDDVSTLDFLRETTNAILPDAFTSMFASTTQFLKSKTEAMVSAVPQPIRRAMHKTGEGIATAADLTGSMLSNVGVYAMRGVPDRVMSPEWKYLIFVDAVNVLKCSLNVNILVAPYIFRMAGLVGGVLLILVMQVVCCYYTEVFFRAKGELKGADHVIMYGDVPRMTFGRWYPTFQLWYDGVTLVATVTYAALNMQALLPHMNIKGDAAKALSFIIPSLFSLPFVFMKRASTQPPMMTLASLLVFVSLVMMFTVFPYGSVVAETIHTIQFNDSVAVLHLFPLAAQEFFVALGIGVFAFTPLSRAVPVERTMRPGRYITLLRVSVLISTVVYIAFGVCAIVSYGSLTCSVLSTSFNDHHTSVEVAVMSLLFFAFLFYIPLNMFELGELSDRRMLGWRVIPRYGEWGPNALRILFLVGCSLIAWCIPYYGLLIAFAGCFGYSVVAIIVPAALDYVCRARYGLLRGRTLRFLDYVITFSGAILGGIICVVGLVMTCYEMWLVVQSGYATTC